MTDPLLLNHTPLLTKVAQAYSAVGLVHFDEYAQKVYAENQKKNDELRTKKIIMDGHSLYRRIGATTWTLMYAVCKALHTKQHFQVVVSTLKDRDDLDRKLLKIINIWTGGEATIQHQWDLSERKTYRYRLGQVFNEPLKEHVDVMTVISEKDFLGFQGGVVLTESNMRQRLVSRFQSPWGRMKYAVPVRDFFNHIDHYRVYDTDKELLFSVDPEGIGAFNVRILEGHPEG